MNDGARGGVERLGDGRKGVVRETTEGEGRGREEGGRGKDGLLTHANPCS